MASMDASTQPSGSQVELIDVADWEGPNRFIMMVHNVFTADECLALIEKSEETEYKKALVNVGGKNQSMLLDVRNSDRAIIDDPKFAEEMWRRICRIVKDDPRLLFPDWANKSRANQSQFRALGLNERLRFLRYDKGHYFVPHYDGSYYRGKEAGRYRVGERSLVTCQLYLNEDFEGGATRFVGPKQKGFNVIPHTGSVLLFEHQLYHEGSIVTRGRKYAIRTDVMYSCKKDSRDYKTDPIMLENKHDGLLLASLSRSCQSKGGKGSQRRN